MITLKEEKDIKFKQLELGLSDGECNAVIDNLKEFMQFSDKQTDFLQYILNFLEGKK